MKIKFYTTDWCGDCVRSKALLNKLNVDFEEINVDINSEANEYITKLQNNQRRIPTIVFEDKTFLVEPSDVELELKLKQLNSDLNVCVLSESAFDIGCAKTKLTGPIGVYNCVATPIDDRNLLELPALLS